MGFRYAWEERNKPMNPAGGGPGTWVQHVNWEWQLEEQLRTKAESVK